ncbi:proline rich transmembrane protein 1B-like [Spea bombifrons]|uniref:proline rich transmembrane protein 1B-like n=1 Tax=Spea bombifrons TaxID=233779 RepID=UPI00234BF2E6|nr:proline rich transmembrane protein 1B-like [Spea bombifrons]
MYQEQKSDNMASPQNYPPNPNSAPYPPSYPNSAPYPPSYPNSAPYPPQYGQPQTFNNVVVNSQPAMMAVSPVRVTYKDYLGLSIFNLICCCLPLGIAALVYSCKTRDSLARGDMVSASSESRTTFTLNMVALGIGITVNIIWIALVSYYTSIVYTYSNSNYYG